MAFEIVDGMTGTKHISSDDLSALNIATTARQIVCLSMATILSSRWRARTTRRSVQVSAWSAASAFGIRRQPL